MKHSKPYKRWRLASIILLLLVAINALAAGYSFMVEPTGAGLGIDTSYMNARAPFADYFFPGLILFSCLGICSLITAFMLIRKGKWSAYLLIVQGLIICGWIVVQLLLVDRPHLLHLVIGSIGVILSIGGWKLLHDPGKRVELAS